MRRSSVGGGSIAQWLAFLIPNPAALGLNLGFAEICSLYSLVRGQHRDQPHLKLKQGISQMQFAMKALAKYNKKILLFTFSFL